MTDNTNICRLCLFAGPENMRLLTDEQDAWQKVEASLSMQIILQAYLPQNICEECISKIQDVYNYYQKVTTAQKLLWSNVDNHSLNNFYVSLKTSSFKVKDEVTESTNNFNSIDDNIDFKPDSKELNSNLSLKLDNSDAILEEDANLDSYENDRSNSPINNEIDENVLQSDSEKCTENSENLDNGIENQSSERIDDIFLNNADSVTKFKCLTCFEMCDTKNSLLSHYNTKHKSKEKGEKAEFETLTSCEGDVTFKCCSCAKTFVNKKGVMKHVLTHASRRSFVCKVCGRTYRTASEIVRHGRAHDGSRLFCRHQCGYSTAYMGALSQHEKRHSGDHYKYKCEQCGKGFEVKTWYLQHQNIHKGLKPYACDICGVAFHMDRYLTAHKSTVHPQSSAVKRYVCPHCSLPCDSRNALTEHLKEHGIVTNFLCDLCGKTVSNAEQLKFHKRMHLGVKPYSCSTCGKSFSRKANLKLHARAHAGPRRSAPRRHATRHDPEANQHKCSKCNKIFASSNSLASHQKKCL